MELCMTVQGSCHAGNRALAEAAVGILLGAMFTTDKATR